MTMLLSLLIIPLLAAALSLAVKSRVAALEGIALAATALQFALSTALAWFVLREGSAAIGTIFSVDALSAIVLWSVCMIGLFASAYSVGYLRAEVAKNIIGFRRVRQYFILVHLFIFAMAFAVMTTVPILMWVAIEATTLSTAFLVSFYNKPSAMEAAWKYLIINSVGLLLAFLGTLLFLTGAPSADGGFATWSTLLAGGAPVLPLIAKMGFIFVIIGYGTKIGFVPMHTWKPDAYSKAPTPVAALFSSALLNVAFLALLRFKVVTDRAVGAAFSSHLLLFFGLFSIAVAAFMLFTQWNYKRMLAYSSIEHAGIAALGFGFGGIGSFAAILHLAYHAFAKSSLFFSAGNVFLKYSSTKIENVRGMVSVMPATAAMLCMGFLAGTGIPPFGTFFTEFAILYSGMAAHPWLVFLALALLALAFVGFLRQVVRMSYKEAAEGVREGEAGLWTVVPGAILLGMLVVFGLYLPGDARALIEMAARSI